MLADIGLWRTNAEGVDNFHLPHSYAALIMFPENPKNQMTSTMCMILPQALGSSGSDRFDCKMFLALNRTAPVLQAETITVQNGYYKSQDVCWQRRRLGSGDWCRAKFQQL